MKQVRIYKYSIIVALIILVGILMPSSDIPKVGIPYMDKVVHCGMFMTLSFSLYWEYIKENKVLPNGWTATLILEGYALLTEGLQLMAEGRTCDIKDFIADSIGIILVSLLARVYYSARIKGTGQKMIK